MQKMTEIMFRFFMFPPVLRGTGDTIKQLKRNENLH